MQRCVRGIRAEHRECTQAHSSGDPRPETQGGAASRCNTQHKTPHTFSSGRAGHGHIAQQRTLRETRDAHERRAVLLGRAAVPRLHRREHARRGEEQRRDERLCGLHGGLRMGFE